MNTATKLTPVPMVDRISQLVFMCELNRAESPRGRGVPVNDSHEKEAVRAAEKKGLVVVVTTNDKFAGLDTWYVTLPKARKA